MRSVEKAECVAHEEWVYELAFVDGALCHELVDSSSNRSVVGLVVLDNPSNNSVFEATVDCNCSGGVVRGEISAIAENFNVVFRISFCDFKLVIFTTSHKYLLVLAVVSV